MGEIQFRVWVHDFVFKGPSEGFLGGLSCLLARRNPFQSFGSFGFRVYRLSGKMSSKRGCVSLGFRV